MLSTINLLDMKKVYIMEGIVIYKSLYFILIKKKNAFKILIKQFSIYTHDVNKETQCDI